MATTARARPSVAASQLPNWRSPNVLAVPVLLLLLLQLDFTASDADATGALSAVALDVSFITYHLE